MTEQVGSDIVFEDEKVRVWNFELRPGESTAMHTHEHDYIWYAISGAPLQLYDENEKDLGVLDVPTGAVFNLKLRGDEIEIVSEPGKGMRAPVRHRAVNAGKEPYREILIEFK
ncbi:MAG: hypothetical protein RIM33_16080 [Alphaproteobacteria bacterium]